MTVKRPEGFRISRQVKGQAFYPPEGSNTTRKSIRAVRDLSCDELQSQPQSLRRTFRRQLAVLALATVL